MMQKSTGYLLLLTLMMLLACNRNRLAVDLSGVDIPPVHIHRLDRELFSLNPNSVVTSYQVLQKKYGALYNIYINGFLNPEHNPDSAAKAIQYFTGDKDMRKAYDQIQRIYTDETMKAIEEELSTSFRYFKYHFPKEELPQRFIAFHSGFNTNFLTPDNTLGIGLDMYLGADSKFYEMLRWPKYKALRLNKEHLVTDCMQAWIYKTFDKNEPVNNLLSHMVFYGKLYYCLDAVLPDTPDSIKIIYTTKQIAYCTKFEKNIWAYFTEQDRLYKNDLKEVSEYVAEGPFTTAFGRESAPRIGVWIGWQIVRAYMNRHPEVTLEQLMKEQDAQKILTASRYKP